MYYYHSNDPENHEIDADRLQYLHDALSRDRWQDKPMDEKTRNSLVSTLSREMQRDLLYIISCMRIAEAQAELIRITMIRNKKVMEE